jgi:hypothetical protein
VKKTEERYVVEARAVQRNLDAPTVARHRDGDVASIPAIEQTQRGLQNNITQPTRVVRAVYEAMDDRATTRTTLLRSGRAEAAAPAAGVAAEAAGDAGHQETAGCPTVSSPWSDPGRPDYFQR